MSGQEWRNLKFSCIWLHFVAFPNRLRGRWDRGCAWGFTLILTFSPQGRRDLQGTGMRSSRLHGNDVYEQCSNQRGYGVRGSCRWFGGWRAHNHSAPDLQTLTRCFAWGFTPKGATGHTLTLTLSQRARGSYRRSYAKIASREKEPAGGKDARFPAFAGNDGEEPPLPPRAGTGMRGSRLRGNDEAGKA